MLWLLLSVRLLLIFVALPPVVALAVPPELPVELADLSVMLSEPRCSVLPLALTAVLCLLALALPPVLPLDCEPVGVMVLVLPLMLVALLPFCAAGLLVPPEVLVVVFVFVLPLMSVAVLPFCAAGLLVPPEVFVLVLLVAELLEPAAMAPLGPVVFCASAAPALRAKIAQLARRSFLMPYFLFQTPPLRHVTGTAGGVMTSSISEPCW